MIYSAREIKAKMEDLIEDGYTVINFIELIESIGWENEDLEKALEKYEKQN